MRKHSSWVGLLLGLSLVFNIYLAYQYSQLAQEQNISWSNNLSEFAMVVNWLAQDPQNFPSVPVSIEFIDNTAANLTIVNRQVENILLLPNSNEVIPFESTQKLSLLAAYHQRILELARNDLKESSKISPQNFKRLQVINMAWFEFLRTISPERNKIDPFSPILKEQAWRNVWLKAIDNMEKVELIPLDE